MSMSANEYQKLALRTEQTPPFISSKSSGDPQTAMVMAQQFARLLHGAVGMATEVGELQDMIKKAVIYGKPLDVVNVLEECGDVLWYIALALDSSGYTMEQAMERNIAKLKARYGDKFSEEAALNRDLDKERAVLEGGK